MKDYLKGSKKARRNIHIVIDSKVFDSDAYNSLTSSAIRVLGQFLRKRKMTKVGKEGKEKWIITNNGELIFTYSEAKLLGFPESTFKRAIDLLIEVGFLWSDHFGTAGYERVPTKYILDNRWEHYGTEKFVVKRRPKQKHRPGFKPKQSPPSERPSNVLPFKRNRA